MTRRLGVSVLICLAMTLGTGLPAAADPGTGFQEPPQGNAFGWKYLDDFRCDFGSGFVPLTAVGAGAAALIGNEGRLIGLLASGTFKTYVDDVWVGDVQVSYNTPPVKPLTRCLYTALEFQLADGRQVRVEGDVMLWLHERGS